MKICLLAYYFPPDQSVGSIRPENWARWLSEKHEVTVIAPRLSANVSAEDDGSYRVMRQRSVALSVLERINGIRKKFRRKVQASSFSAGGEVQKKNSGVFTYRMPCLHDLWFFSSLVALCKVKPDIVIATHSPYINLVSAWVYTVFFQKTILWIDYRDLWTNNHTVIGVFGIRVLEKLIERKILKSAQVITSVSNFLCQEIQNILHKNVYKVYNAPVPIIKQHNNYIDNNLISICYVGTIYSGWRDPSKLFEHILKYENTYSHRSLKIIFASRNAGNFFSIVDKYGAHQFLDYRGAVSREESLALQQQSDILLLLESNAPEARGVLTGKVFEYLMTDKPILLVGPGPDSELYQLLQKHDRLFTLDDLDRFLRGEMKVLPKGAPVDYSEISRGQLLAIMDDLSHMTSS